MAIDIRATVTCSLGTLISGSISDDYLQGSGLVKVRGNCEISGLITPAAGTIVTFSYTKDGVTYTFPRKLRVLSSFADPFRRITQVELGCKLTYLSDYRPAPTVDGEPSVETGKRQQCLNGYVDWPASSQYGIPISAAGLLTTCCERLEITAASNPLTNKFFRDSFDFSPGYVSVLNDLLVSESYFGYLDTSEVLQIVSLDQDGGTGPVFTSADIVDLGPIGTGPLPGDAVVVRYDSLKLKEDLENEDIQIFNQRNWTEDEVIGDEETVSVRYTAEDGNTYENYFSYIPYTKTITEYGQDDSWSDTTCVLVDTNGEGADLSNSVVKRTTYKRIIKAAGAPDYCAQLLAAGIEPNGGQEDDIVTIETYEYDSDGQITRQTTEVYEPAFIWAGRLNIQWVYETEYVTFGARNVLVSKTVETVTTLYADRPKYIYLDPGETYRRIVNGQKVVTTVYQNFAVKQFGQQAISGANQNAAFEDVTSCVLYIQAVERQLVLVETTVRTSRDRVLMGIERRPPVELRLGLNGANERGEYKSELLYTAGSPLGKRIVEFSMPLQSDDYYSSTGAIIKGDAPAKANRYGRVQNRLLLGNRSGVNLQLAPERLPVAPFSPLYLQADGLTALYRANGNQWAFDSNGIVCSTDALFWAAVGGTGTFWFPVAPGITTLPPEPPIVDGAMNANTVVLPYNETAIYDSRISLGTIITKFEYSLTLLTEVPAAPIRLRTVVQRSIVGTTGSFALSGQAAQLRRPASILRADAGSFAVSDQPVRFRPDRLYPTDPGVFTLSLQPAPISYSGGDPYWNSVKLLLHMNGANNSTTFTDSGPLALTVTPSTGAVISTAQSKFDGASAYVNGATSAGLSVADNDAWNIGATDFTAEGWIRLGATQDRPIFSQESEPSNYGWEIFIGSTYFAFWCSPDGINTPDFEAPSWNLALDTWAHFAVCRSGNTLRMFKDGTLIQTHTITTNIFNSTAPLLIGKRISYISTFTGYLDELRFTRAARYTASFSVQTSAFREGPQTV